MKYIRRRLLHGVFVLAGVSALCFVFSDIAPGSFLDEMKLNPQISAETVNALRQQYGLNQPLPERYFLWLKSVAAGQWGYSFAYGSSVRSLVTVRARNTLLLTGISTSLLWLMAVPLGVWIAGNPGRWGDRLCMGVTSLLLSVPELVLALGLLYWVVRTNALPVGGMASLGLESAGTGPHIWDLVRHLVVPVTVLVLAGLPIIVRHVRASMMEVLSAPFVHAARGHGIGKGRILFRYALPAAANPLISLFGISIGGLLSGSLLVEAITGWPGLGPLLLEAAMSRDLYVMVGTVMLSAFFMVAGNLLADVLLVAVDPRIRME
jgi:peptide/nickel transport system permease protein